MARTHKSDIRKNYAARLRQWIRHFEAHPIDDESTEFAITLIGNGGEETYILTTSLEYAHLFGGLDNIMALNALHKMYVIGTKLREVRNGYHTMQELELWNEFHELADEVCGLVAGIGYAQGLYLS